MKSIIGAILVGVVLFGASASLSWFLTKTEEPSEEVADAEQPVSPSAFPAPLNDADKTDLMPVSLRPETPLTVEAVTQLADSIMAKEEKLFQKQTFLQKEEQRIGVLFEDLKHEREKLIALEQQIDAKILSAREKTVELKQAFSEFNSKVKELASLEKKTGKTSEDVVDEEMIERVDKVKGWFKDLEPEISVELLKNFAKRGDREFAGRLLDSLDKRKIAGILGGMDPVMAAEIIDAYTSNENFPKSISPDSKSKN
ncbi:MAG: flagellar motility protein MotE (MotC chaperone) [Mariniblastus sp.]|jgi:flagellar motility protein MotE (MotC chaperone)